MPSAAGHRRKLAKNLMRMMSPCPGEDKPAPSRTHRQHGHHRQRPLLLLGSTHARPPGVRRREGAMAPAWLMGVLWPHQGDSPFSRPSGRGQLHFTAPTRASIPGSRDPCAWPVAGDPPGGRSVTGPWLCAGFLVQPRAGFLVRPRAGFLVRLHSCSGAREHGHLVPPWPSAARPHPRPPLQVLWKSLARPWSPIDLCGCGAGLTSPSSQESCSMLDQWQGQWAESGCHTASSCQPLPLQTRPQSDDTR